MQSVLSVCRDDDQKQKLLKLKEIDSKKVAVSLPRSLQKRDKPEGNHADKPITWNKGVITRVPLDVSIDDVKLETGAIWARRITNRTKDACVPTTAVIIAYGIAYVHLVRVCHGRMLLVRRWNFDDICHSFGDITTSG